MSYNFLRRFNADKTIDTTFNDLDKNVLKGSILTICPRDNGNLLIGGDFAIQEHVFSTMARIDMGGNIDPTLPPLDEILDTFTPDRSSLRFFEYFQGFFYIQFVDWEVGGRSRILRIDKDLLQYSIFTIEENVNSNDTVGFVKSESINRLILLRENSVLAIDPNGDIDNVITSTLNGIGFSDLSRYIQTRDGKVYLFCNYHTDEEFHNVVRLNEDLTFDTSFSIPLRPWDVFEIDNNRILVREYDTVIIHPNGDIQDILLPDFSYCYYFNEDIFFLFYDGRLAKYDPSFDLIEEKSFPLMRVYNSISDTNGVFLNGQNQNYDIKLIKLNQGWDVDTSSNYENISIDYEIYSLRIIDDYLYTLGDFRSLGSPPKKLIAELGPNGDFIDTVLNFDDIVYEPGAGVSSIIKSQDGKYYIGGIYHASYGGVEVSHLCRLNADLTLDPTFSNAEGFPYAEKIIIHPDSGVLFLIGQGMLVKLNSDGTIDYDFDDTLYENFYSYNNPINLYHINNLCVAPDGSILLVGQAEFQTENGSYISPIIRIDQDGNPYPNFMGFDVFGTGSEYLTEEELDYETHTSIVLIDDQILLGTSSQWEDIPYRWIYLNLNDGSFIREKSMPLTNVLSKK